MTPALPINTLPRSSTRPRSHGLAAHPSPRAQVWQLVQPELTNAFMKLHKELSLATAIESSDAERARQRGSSSINDQQQQQQQQQEEELLLMTERGRRHMGCSNAACTNAAGASEAALPRRPCGDCRKARYCSTDCCKADWKRHRKLCRLLCEQARNE